MNSLPALPNFAPVAGLTQAQINAEYKAAIELEARYKLAAREAAVVIRAEFRAEVIARYQAIAKAAFERQIECYTTFRANHAAAQLAA